MNKPAAQQATTVSSEEGSARDGRMGLQRYHRGSVIWIVLAASGLIVLVVLSTNAVAGSASGTWDETLYLFLGRQAATGAGGEAFPALGVAPLPVRLIFNTRALEPLALEHNDPSVYRARIDRARQNAAWWFAVPLVLSIFIWLSRLRNWRVAVAGAALVALSPNIVAHASLATTDVAFTTTFVLTLIAMSVYLKGPSWVSAAMLAVTLGLALATKYSAIALFVAVIILMPWRMNLRSTTTHVLVLFGALLVAWAGHEWSVMPLMTPNGLLAQTIERGFSWTGGAHQVSSWLANLQVPSYVRGIAAQMYLERQGQEAFLLGKTSQFGWWYYLPVALALKSTPVELAAFGAFAVLSYQAARSGIEGRVLATSAAVFAALALIGQRNLGIRYVLPLVVIALVGAVMWLNDRLRNRRVACAAALIALAVQGGSLWAIAPQPLAYFNQLAGGPARGYVSLVDSNLDWGQDLIRLHDWLQDRGTNRAVLAYFGSAPVGAYGIEAVSARQPSPSARWVVISATYLQGIFLCDDPFAEFRGLTPDDRAGYSLLIYDANRQEVQEALRLAQSRPCTP